MSAWHHVIDVPVLAAASDSPTFLAITAAAMVLTAPSPDLAATLQPPVSSIVLIAPSPTLPGILAVDDATVAPSAPDPQKVGNNILTVPASAVGLSAPDPAPISPYTVAIDAAMVNITAPQPTVDYGFVTSETVLTYPGVPPASARGEEHRRQIASVVNRSLQGKIACTGTLTLLPNVAATYLRDDRLTAASWVEFDPLTATAAAEKYGGTLLVFADNRQDGQWLISHADDPADDRTFRYSVLG